MIFGQKYPLWILLLLVFLTMGNLTSVAQDEKNGKETPAKKQNDEGGAKKDSAKEDDAKKEEVKKPAEQSQWMKNVDKWFGDYLVTPMSTVLFFDFFTGPKKANDADNDGNPDHSWTSAYNATRDAIGIPEKGWLHFGPNTIKVDVSAAPDVEKELTFNEALANDSANADYKIVVEDGKYVIRDKNDGLAANIKPEANEAGAKKIAAVLTSLAGKRTNGTSVPFVVIWLLLGGIYFTIKMAFINIRGFWHAIRLTRGDYDDPNNEGDVSHFQALSAALSATVGLGNIAGVAIAISTGGPGATLWMVIIGLIGMSSKFTECSLGQMYRKIDEEGKVSGGPMHYLKDGLANMGMKPLGLFLAGFFSLLCIGGSIGGGNTFQVVQSLGAIKEDPAFSFLNDMPWIYGLVMVTLVGLVIIGGIKSIGKVAGRIVPFMCGVYVLFALIILAKNAGAVPAAFGLIFSQAFSPQAVYGGFIGVLVIGITRAVFSNEAGTGSAAIAHSAAKTDKPVTEGIVALLEPFIDTVVVCTMTALVIIVSGAYASGDTEALRAAGNGAGLTAYAFQTAGFTWFKYVLYAAVFLFAFSTCISWSYYGERCFTHWFGRKSSMVYKVLFLIFTFLGSIVSAANIQAFSDILILSMALPNVLGVLILSGSVKKELQEYWSDLESGKIKPHSETKK